MPAEATGIINTDNVEDIGTKYAEDIVNGVIPACWQVKAQCKRHLKDLQDVASGKRTDIRYNLDQYAKVIKFAKLCKHFKGAKAGQPFILAPFQHFIVAGLYAWQRYDALSNRWVFKHTQNFIMMGKKNGKSALISIFTAFDALFGEATGAEVYIGAATQDQAKIVYNSTEAFIRFNKILSENFTILGNTIFTNGTQRTSFIKPFGRDSKKEGLNVFRAYIDELHDHPDGEVFTTLSDGMVGRTNCGCTVITTAGDDVYSFCKKQQDYCEEILKGNIDSDNAFTLIYQGDRTKPLNDIDNLRLANPALGTVKPIQPLLDNYNQCLHNGTLNNFIYKNLCLWTDDTEAWIDSQKWNAQSVFNFQPDEPDLKNKTCYIGVDLSHVRDLSAVVLFFPIQNGLKYNYVKSFFWIPKNTAKAKQLKDKIPFDEWQANGYVNIVDTDAIRTTDIANFILELRSQYTIQGLLFDYNMSGEFCSVLTEAGLNIKPSRQGFALTKDITATEALIYNKELRHDNNPCLNWNVSNAVVKIGNNGEKRIDRSNVDKKIDGVIALVQSIGANTYFTFNGQNKPREYRHSISVSF